MGGWGDGGRGRWGDGEMGRWGDGEMGGTTSGCRCIRCGKLFPHSRLLSKLWI
ncbi:MAG: hypothetical protein F6J99_39460 [Moorea sp. SIO4G3]|nr:hypothetical protein [Moorena sp. SIO4G3]